MSLVGQMFISRVSLVQFARLPTEKAMTLISHSVIFDWSFLSLFNADWLWMPIALFSIGRLRKKVFSVSFGAFATSDVVATVAAL